MTGNIYTYTQYLKNMHNRIHKLSKIDVRLKIIIKKPGDVVNFLRKGGPETDIVA